MKKLLALGILYQLILIDSRLTVMSAEQILAGRAIRQGLVPYRDFFLHVGPLPAYLFALLNLHNLFLCAFVFVCFNFLTAGALWKMGLPLMAVLYLFLCPFFDGNKMYVETIMTAFGVWAFYFAQEKQRIWASVMVLLAVMTKVTGIVFALCLL